MVQEGPAPTEEQLSRLAAIGRSGPRQSAAPTEDKLAPWADQVYQWLTGDRLEVTRVQELLAERGCRVSYASLHRFVARRNWRRRNPGTVRMAESAPGEVAELDFGRLGLVADPETGRRRTVWALIVVLAHCRHSFVWPTAGTASSGPPSARSWRTSSPDWRWPGPSSAASPGTWSWTISRRRWLVSTRCTPGSPAASWNAPSTAASSANWSWCAIPRTSPGWSAASSTFGSVSSKAATSADWHT